MTGCSPLDPESPLRWDAPLLSTLARTLDLRLRGARLRAMVPEFEARRLTLYFREATLVVRLHPTEAGLFLLDPADPPTDARPLAARLRAVEAPPDDRLVVLSLLRVRGAPAEVDLVVEFITNRHNAVLTEGPERTIRLLFQTREGRRVLRQGHPYAFPSGAAREGVTGPVEIERWRQVWTGADTPGDRRRALLSTFGWTSPIQAEILAGLGPEESYRLWRTLGAVARGERPPVPVILDTERGPQPYPLPLPGVPHRPASDLLDAVAQATADAATGDRPLLLPAVLVSRLEGKVDGLRSRCTRLEEELAGLADADRVQALGDLLLARFGDVPQGEGSVTLSDFEGGEVEVELDPTLTPDANARAYYDEAARIRRARERLPKLAAEARRAWDEANRLLDRARRGEATAAEVEAALPDEAPGSSPSGPALPYRRYRSSGGLEIRVGRGARRNDDLTFRHSSPDDVWLHARDTAGAHVILRWDRDGNPPARDLAEAAVLAALGSKARTSGSVPVDWTRRKYVRKPRKAPPGLVLPERVSTVFVEPDPAVEARLREE